MLSTHILSEVQATCDEIKMIEHGNVVFSGTIRDFNNYMAPSTLVTILENPPQIEELEKIPGILKVEKLTATRFRCHFDGNDHGMTRRKRKWAWRKGGAPAKLFLNGTHWILFLHSCPEKE